MFWALIARQRDTGRTTLLSVSQEVSRLERLCAVMNRAEPSPFWTLYRVMDYASASERIRGVV